MERIQFGGRRVAGFGVGAWYDTSGSDKLAALINNSDALIKTLNDSFQAFGPRWASIDMAAFNDFGADLVRLNGRYNVAKLAALANATGFWATTSDVDRAFTAISKAFRQNYQPGDAILIRNNVVAPADATVSDVKGDYSNLVARLRHAQESAGAPVMVEPTHDELAKLESDNISTDFYKSTAPLDIIAQLRHEMAPHAPAVVIEKAEKDALSALEWIEEHKTGIAIGATVLIGGILYAIVRR